MVEASSRGRRCYPGVLCVVPTAATGPAYQRDCVCSFFLATPGGTSSLTREVPRLYLLYFFLSFLNLI